LPNNEIAVWARNLEYCAGIIAPLSPLMLTLIKTRVVRILHYKIHNSARITCKFCAHFLWILCTFHILFSSRFSHFWIISGIALRPC